VDQVSQIQNSQFNASSLNSHPYISGASSLFVGREGLVQVDTIKSLEQPVLRSTPAAAEISLLK
jgi:hypothetical protein